MSGAILWFLAAGAVLTGMEAANSEKNALPAAIVCVALIAALIALLVLQKMGLV